MNTYLNLIYFIISMICVSSHVQANVNYVVKDLHDYFGEDQTGHIHAEAINDNGVIAGSYEYHTDNGLVSQAFIIDTRNGSLNFMTPPQLMDCEDIYYAIKLNNQNQALLQIDENAYLWDIKNGLKVIDLSKTLKDANIVTAHDLNNLGQVLISISPDFSDDILYYFSHNDYFVWEAGKELIRIPLHDLIPERTACYNLSLNDSGQILFSIFSFPSCNPFEFQTGYGMYENGVLTRHQMAPATSDESYSFIDHSQLNQTGEFVFLNHFFDDKIGFDTTHSIYISKDKNINLCIYQQDAGQLPLHNYINVMTNDRLQVVANGETYTSGQCHYDEDTDEFFCEEYGNAESFIKLWTSESGWANLRSLVDPDYRYISECWDKDVTFASSLNNLGQILIVDMNDYKSYLMTACDDFKK